MDRQAFICIVAFGLVTAAAGAHAQPAAKIPRIGSLCPTQCPGHPLNEKVFLPALREYGWVVGQNIAIEYRNAHGKAERLPALAAELVALKVDILTAPSQAAAIALKKATTTIPIAFAGVGDPVAAGLVTSMVRPGGNLTGITQQVDGRIEVKRLELLKQANPPSLLWLFSSTPPPSTHGRSRNSKRLPTLCESGSNCSSFGTPSISSRRSPS